MTKDDLYFSIQAKKTLEFQFQNKAYTLYYDKDSKGNEIIMFGRLYEAQPYDSFGDLMNNAKIDNYFLKDLLGDIQ